MIQKYSLNSDLSDINSKVIQISQISEQSEEKQLKMQLSGQESMRLNVIQKSDNASSSKILDQNEDFNNINDENFIASKKRIEGYNKEQIIDNEGFFKKMIMYDYLKVLIRCSQSIKMNKILQLNHIPPLSQEQQVELKFQILHQKFQQIINESNIEQKEISKFKIISAIISTFKSEIGLLLLTNTLYNFLKILYSSFLIFFLDSVQDSSSTSLKFFLAIILALIQFLGIAAGHNILRFFYNFFPVFKAAFMKILFHKIITLSAFSVKQANIGKLINLVSSDLNTLDSKGLSIIKTLTLFFDIAAVALILYQRLGASSLIGFCFILSNPLFQILFAKLSQRYFSQKAQLVDQRIKFTNEVIEGIRLIKMYAWEEAFVQFVSIIRNNEMSKILIIQIIFLSQQSFNAIFNLLACFISFLSTYYLGDAAILTVPRMLSVLDLFTFTKSEIIGYASVGITGFYELKIIIDRAINVLTIQQSSVKKLQNQSNTETDIFDKLLPKGTINMNNFSAFWNQNTPVLKKINLQICSGDFVAIVGRIGSGKSSLLSCILKEVPYIEGDFKFNGRIAYVEQEPYIFSSSIKENIIFGLDYDDQLYKQVLEACCLNEDLQQFDNGDLTEIGERGINLSGGQKARISLARAIYSQSDIILLDDPLSAVDSKVAKQIIEKAILKTLKGKTILMVTHHVHFAQRADKILIMKEGEIYKQGIYAELQHHFNETFNDLELSKQINHYPSENKIQRKEINFQKIDQDKDEDNSPRETFQDRKKDEEKEILIKSSQVKQIFTKEQDENMEVSFLTYKQYFGYSSLRWLILVMLVLFISCEIFYVFYTKTISNYNQSDSDMLDRLHLLGYLTLIFFINYFLKYLLFTLVVYSSNKNIHENMIKSLVRATVLFFDTTPSGRILNKFSSDLGILDQQITRTMICSLEIISSTCVFLITIFILNPYFIIVIFIQMVFTRLFVNFSKKSLQQSKLLDLRYRSPIYTCFNQTIQGVLPIKTYKKENIFMNNFSILLQNSLKATISFNMNQRGFSIYTHLATALFSNLGIFMILLINNSSDSLGQAILFFINISDYMQFGLRMMIDTDTSMSSAQRVMNVINIDKEPETRCQIDQSFIDQRQISFQNDQKNEIYKFPLEGAIEFNNVRMKYRKDLSYVLNGLSFKISAGEKVGFVGRTGAGKSSVIQAIYRMTEIEQDPDQNGQKGVIKIDGFNLKELGIHTIRAGISIIPQIPFVFSGSIRRNLDPLNQYSDSQINQILEEISLKEKILNLKDGFHTDMTNANDVFSSGEKQLICLGRAILRQSKLIVLDEATANCDLQTDKIIQQKIRERFQNSTLITIAHRLNTIADYDKIIVLENGTVVEQGIPYELLQQDNSVFKQMVLQTGQNNFHQIFKTAEISYKKL
ncbi:hypothetical protein ABPG74_019325 [Tetrahymena malaccensis]